MKIGDKVKYVNIDQEAQQYWDFGIGTVKALSANTEHIWVETENTLLRGWYHDYNLEVVNDSQRTN